MLGESQLRLVMVFSLCLFDCFAIWFHSPTYPTLFLTFDELEQFISSTIYLYVAFYAVKWPELGDGCEMAWAR